MPGLRFLFFVVLGLFLGVLLSSLWAWLFG